MKSFIKYISVFSEKGEKRYVKLNEGVNIITGDSKSGKTALMEIIDYCLGSSKSTIPKGEITRFSQLYVIVMKVKETWLILAREPYFQEGRNRMFFKEEAEEIASNIDKLSLNYFVEEYFDKIDNVIKTLGDIFGLKVRDMTDEAEVERKKGRPSIRNTVSYIFQHQNLIASKFAMFYRFNEYYKRQDVIEQFPVFAGIVDQEYYFLKQKKDELEKKKKLKVREKNDILKYMEEKKADLIHQFKTHPYFSNIEINESSLLKNMQSLLETMPTFSSDYYLSDNDLRLGEIEDTIESLKYEKGEIQIQIDNLNASIGYGNRYIDTLNDLKLKIRASNTNIKTECPLCQSKVKNVSKKIIKLSEAQEWLRNELSNTEQDKIHYFISSIDELEKNKKNIEKKIKLLKGEYDALLSQHESLKERRKYQEQTIYAKVKIEESLNLLKGNKLTDIDSEIGIIEQQLRNVTEDLDAYDIYSHRKEAEAIIQKFMNKVVERLDFEEELKPVNLKFDTETFDFYQYVEKGKDRGKIFLSSMGSGANWLSCHLGLFLALLYYFCLRGNKSSVPSILYLDQPSQVYFPHSFDKNSPDIRQVENIYNVILSVVDKIKKDTSILPQVIITDHADSLNLKNYDFEKLVDGRRWRGKKFI